SSPQPCMTFSAISAVAVPAAPDRNSRREMPSFFALSSAIEPSRSRNARRWPVGTGALRPRRRRAALLDLRSVRTSIATPGVKSLEHRASGLAPRRVDLRKTGARNGADLIALASARSITNDARGVVGSAIRTEIDGEHEDVARGRAPLGENR